MNIEPLDPSQPSRAQLRVEMNCIAKLKFNTFKSNRLRRKLALQALENSMLNDKISKDGK